MPEWLKYGLVIALAGSGGTIGQYVGATQPAKVEEAATERSYQDTMAANETIRSMLEACNVQLQACWKECR